MSSRKLYKKRKCKVKTLDNQSAFEYNNKRWRKVNALYASEGVLMAEKDFTVYELYSIYGKMLTETQARAIADYFGLDLSLGEIALNRGISRQSVKDALSCAEKQLFNLEQNLRFYEKLLKIRALAKSIKAEQKINDEPALSVLERVLGVLEE